MSDRELLLNSKYIFDQSEYDDDPKLLGRLVINLNDTFGWALAYCAEISDDKIPEVAELYRKWGYPGLLYWSTLQPGNITESEFKDINRFIDFVRREEEQEKREPNHNKRAYMDLPSKENE